MIILQHAETDSSFCLMCTEAKYITFIYRFLSVYTSYNITILAPSTIPPPPPQDLALVWCLEISNLRGI